MATQTSVTLETITPQKAEQYLASMKINRKLRMRHLEVLTEEMRAGRWQVNGETLKFNEQNQLIDGQHRLWAVIKAGTSMQSYVVRQLAHETNETIDIGLKRSPGDILGLSGYSDPTNLAASARWVWRYETEQMENYRVNPSIEILKRTIALHSELKNSLPYGQLLGKLIVRSLAAALHCLMSEKDAEATTAFFTKLKDGEELKRGESIYMLRNRLIANSQAKARLPHYEVAALTIKAFNYFRSKDAVLSLRWRTGGDRQEQFPRIS